MPDEENQPAPQVDPRDEEITRLRAEAQKFGPLAEIAEHLSADPSKIYALRAAMEGNFQPAQQQIQENQNRTSQLTPEQIQQLNLEALQNPAEFAIRAANMVADQKLAQFAGQATPYITATADNFIAMFKQNKAAEDSLYKQIAPLFDRQMNDINRQALLGLSPAIRTRELELRWSAAADQVFRRASVAREQEQARNLGSGGNGGTQAPKKKTAYDKDPTLAGLVDNLKGQGYLSEEELAAIWTEIESENE